MRAVRKILVISLSNIGDVILTFPVVDILKRDFPGAELSLVVGPKAAPLLEANPRLRNLWIFDKRQPAVRTMRWIGEMRAEHFDLIVDLRNTAIPFLLRGGRRTSPILKRRLQHMRSQHLDRLRTVHPFEVEAADRNALYVPPIDEQYIGQVLDLDSRPESLIAVAPGAADKAKRWTVEGFARTCDHLAESRKARIILVGDRSDDEIARMIANSMRHRTQNLCGKTSLTQLAEVLKKCSLLVTNDSAPMHLASYLDLKVLALFGPTDPARYGPWSRQNLFIKKADACPACSEFKAKEPHTCMSAITGEEAVEMVERLMSEQ